MAERRKTDIKRDILKRVRWLYAIFFLIGVAIAGKILYIQYGPQGDELRSRGARITYERVTIEADRGDILSRDGRLLATSVPMYEVRMDFNAQGLKDSTFQNNVDSLAWCLSNFFGDRSKESYRKRLVDARANRTKNRFVLLSPRRVNHLEIKEIARFPIFRLGANRGGFIPQQTNRRLKPNGTMASRTIGMVNEAGDRVGIEGAFDSILRGTDGNVLMQRISGSFRIPVPDPMSVDPVDGIDVVTTLDVDIQDVAESALRRQLIAGGAEWGTAVLMEVATGEIRAMANLTRRGTGNYVEDFNYAIGMNLEPGSTFKLASLMTLLDAGGASMEEHFNTHPGSMMVGKVRVVDTHNCGDQPLSGVFEHSSNVGFALAVNKYFRDRPEKFVSHLRKMGLDKPLDLQIPGEIPPVIRTPGERWWDGTTLTMMSYGYALRLTPLKTLSFYNAVANNGRMMRPMLVKELRQYGQTLRTYQPEEMVSSIGSKETIRQAQEALQGVVEDGTARVLKNPHYKVAGKTGTAQIAQGSSGYTDKYGGRHYLATLVCYFPADNPRYSCIVAMKTYRGPGSYGTYYGASLAGPVVRAIADRVYAQSTEWQTPLSKQGPKSDDLPPIKPGRASEMKQVASRLGLPAPQIPRGTEWIGLPARDSLATPNVITPTAGVVPDVRGMGLKEALYLLEKTGHTVSFSGIGGVTSQSLPPGTRTTRGQLVTIRLSIAQGE